LAANFCKLISWIGCVGGLFAFAAAGYSAQEDRIRHPIDGVETVVLAGNTNPKARPGNDRGALDSATRVSGVTILMGQTQAQTADLEHLLEAQRDPASVDYQNWLSPEEFGERFGLSENDLASMQSWLQFHGLTVERVARGRNYITFSGTAGQIAKAFGAELHYYEADGEKHFANAGPPSIPASLSGIVTGIRGLDDFRPKPQRAIVRMHPDFDASNGGHYLAPDDLATIYDIQSLYAAGFDGSGQKLAIAGQTDINLGDIRGFRSNFKLTAKDPQLVLVGDDPGVNSGDQIEADLDIEWSGAVARNATIVYVYSQNVFESVQYAIDQNLAPVLSLSYGGCEIGSPLAVRSLAQQANAQGITWMNASGDSGAAGCDDGEKVATQPPAVLFPADIPEVTAVGGTELNDSNGTFWSSRNGSTQASALSYIPETAWNDTALGNGLAAGGGGASSIYAKPWWQTGPGVPNDHARDVPDVALNASGAHDSYLIYTRGGLMSVGGTSAASPSFAGIAAILNQYLVSNGQAKAGLGNMNPLLYSLAQNAAGVFHDITAGDNIVPCAAGVMGCVGGSYGYKAGAGYDLATGLGSVDAYNLVTKWSSLAPVVGTKTMISASPASIAQSATTQLTATVSAVTGTNIPAGTLLFTAGSVSLGSAVLTGSGMATLAVQGSVLSAGANTISATYLGSGSFGNSTAATTVTVTGTTIATSIVVTAAPAIIAQNGSTILTAVVKPVNGTIEPGGVVTFVLGTTPIGAATLTAAATGANATLTVKASSLALGVNTLSATYGGSGTFSGSTAVPVTVTVTPPPITTTTTLTASLPAFAQNSSTELTATVKPASGSVAPAGAVSFLAGNTLLGIASVKASGSTATATFTVKANSLALGSGTLAAVYSGSTGFAVSSGTVSVTVNPAPVATALTLTASLSNIASPASTLLTATLTALAGSASPTGTVTFAAGNTTLGTAPLTVTGGTAAAVLIVKGSSLPAGADNIVATYIPGGNFTGSASSVVVNVGPLVAVTGTTMAVTASPATITPTGTTQLTVTLKAVTGSSSPTGTVTFMKGTTSLGSAILAGSGGTSVATLTLKGSSLATGSNTIAVTYSSGSFAAAGGSVTVNIAKPSSASK
jgi:subtilase family serine protease